MPLPLQHVDQRPQRGRLAGARPARQDADLVRERGVNGLLLLCGERRASSGGSIGDQRGPVHQAGAVEVRAGRLDEQAQAARRPDLGG